MDRVTGEKISFADLVLRVSVTRDQRYNFLKVVRIHHRQLHLNEYTAEVGAAILSLTVARVENRSGSLPAVHDLKVVDGANSQAASRQRCGCYAGCGRSQAIVVGKEHLRSRLQRPDDARIHLGA